MKIKLKLDKQLILENANYIKNHFNQKNKEEIILGFIGAVPVIGTLANITGNAKIGRDIGYKIGHKNIGTVAGKEGALGAASNKYIDINMLDAYTKENIINKFINGSSTGAIIGSIGGPIGVGIGASIGGIASAAIIPGMKYHIGKSIHRKINENKIR